MTNRPSSPPLLLACLAVTVLVIVCIFLTEAPQPPPPFPPAIRSEPRVEPEPVVVEDEPSGIYITDGGNAGASPGLAIPMPEGPLKGQKRPKDGSCHDKRQVALNGGCWRELADKPTPEDGCGADAYEKNRKCYAWVRETPKLPSSLEVQPPPPME